jgi:hypothetical protein
MNSKALIILLFCLIWQTALAQNNCHCTLQGTIIAKETQQKIANANIYLKGTKWGTKSNSEG